jgi:hypothetical protein
MNQARKLIHCLIAVLILIGAGSQLSAVQPVFADEPLPPVKPDLDRKVDYSEGRPGISAEQTATSDNYGYTLDAGAVYNWIEINSTGAEVSFTNLDDGYSNPIQIGFNFKFYENSYPELYVSTNGLITFGKGSYEFVNRPIPRDTTPDNLLAAFWDDLQLPPGSKVFTYAGNGASGKYFIVEWSQVTRLNSPDQLTFQAILYENGYIIFQYKQLNGVIDQATVGIEDSNGIDGLLYLYNSSGLSASKAIRFIRPALGPRVKLTPHDISGFTSDQVASLKITVINTGEQGPDSYNLTTSSVLAGWSVNLHRADTGALLTDTNQDGKIDTGLIAQGDSRKVYLKIRAPGTADPGAAIQLNLTAASSLNPSKTASSIVQAAVPAPFAQAVFDSYAGMRLQLIWKENQVATRLTENQFTGSNLSIVSLPDQRYFYAWEKNNQTNGDPPIPYTNLEYAILNHYGAITKPIGPLTDNSNVTLMTADRSLYLAGLTNGRVGAVWVRSRSQNSKTNFNIYFSILTSDGQVVVPPTNVTNNDGWSGQGSLDVPIFNSPRIVTSGSDRFILAWNDIRQLASGTTSDLYAATYDQNGTNKKPPTKLTDSLGSGFQYGVTAPVSLANTNVLLATVRTDIGDPLNPSDDLSTTTYRILDRNLDTVLPEKTISGSVGSTPDGAQIDSEVVLLAWNVPGTEELQYVTLSGADFNNQTGPVTIVNPKNRVAGVVSVTRDGDGHGVLTWSEAEQFEYLSYALVDSTGVLLTSPMIFTTGLGEEPKIDTNTYGVGNAYYGGSWQIYLPATQH